MTESANAQFIIRLSMLGAVTTMAFQVAGKAARDALFLSHYRPSQLPLLVVVAALTAIVLSIVQGRILNYLTPARFVPWLLMGSASLQVLEWITWDRHPGPSSIAVYIHVVALGALITSGFWSVINEQFDPWTAKQAFGKIAGAGTVGGVAGGFLAERLGAMATPHSVLLAMATMQVLTAASLFLMPRRETEPRRGSALRLRSWDLLSGSSYFRQLSLLVLTGTFAAALLDYVLKASARHTLGPGEPLLRFFALFHTGTALISFVFQFGATSALLNRLGLGATVSTLPASVSVSSSVAALMTGLPVVTGARAVEAVVRGSFFRAGYELLYTPMLPSEKRVIKSFNDVTVDRLGDALGGGFAQAAIHLAPTLSSPVMLATASAASVCGWLLSRTLNRGYVGSLERSLEHYADEEPASVTALSVPPAEDVQTPRPLTPEVREQQFQALVHADETGLAHLLEQPVALDRGMLPFVVPLLANSTLRRPAARAIQAVAAENAGQLADYLLDTGEPLEVRRRIPALLAAAENDRAVAALLTGLRDSDIAVRVVCGRALDYLRQNTELSIPEEPVLDAIRSELRGTQTQHRMSLEHIFVLLAVVLSREHVRIAYDALMTGQEHLRGIAREYLETSLPPDISESLLEAVQPQPVRLE